MLVVDDQPQNRELLGELLGAAGYEVTLVDSGAAALASALARPPDAIVLDVMMPRMDGFEVCRRLKADPSTRFVPIVMVTALADVASRVHGLEVGADDFLSKPVQTDELLTRVRVLIRIRRLRQELDSADEIILTLVNVLDSRDPREHGHAGRVAVSALATATALGLPAAELESVTHGALLHDIGKLTLPDAALAPDSGVHPSLRQHPELAVRVLQPLRSLRGCLDIVRHHHERLDGSGYPDGLHGEAFRPAVEVVALANHYDNLRQDEGQNAQEAAARLREEARHGRFRSDTVECFLRVGLPALDAAPRAGRTWSELRDAPALQRPGRVLVCDDSAANRELLCELLERAGHEVLALDDPEAVLPAIVEHDFDLVVLDVRMPRLDGFTLCDWIKRAPETRLLPVLLVTAGQAEERQQIRRTQVEADDLLRLPVDRLEFLARVRSLLRLKLYHRDLEGHQSVLLALATLLEARDPYHRGHSTRVGDIAAQLAHELGLDQQACEELRVAGLLHDIGELSLPERLVAKPGPLDDHERAQVRRHALLSTELIAALKTARAVLPAIQSHHERYNGSGYPAGLRGDAIPLAARVLGLADAYDALTSDRAHRPRLHARPALDVLARETEAGLWDPGVFAALRALTQPLA